MTTKEAAREAWFNGAKFSDNPYRKLTPGWAVWACEWGRLQDKRDDDAAGNDG